MKLIEAAITSTRLDAHGTVTSVEALEGAAEQLSTWYVPVNVEHDIRFPPVGRVVAGRVEPAGDGEHVLVAVQEIFEVGDTLDEITSDGRTLIQPISKPTSLAIEYDRWFNTPAGQPIIERLAAISSEKPRETLKRSVDPIGVIGLAVGVIDLLSPAAINLFHKLRRQDVDQLEHIVLSDIPLAATDASMIVDVNFVVTIDGHEVEAHVLADTRDREACERLFWPIIGELRRRLENLDLANLRVIRVVFAFQGSWLTFRYAVRDDGAPLAFVDGVPTLITLAQVEPDGVHIVGERWDLYEERPESDAP